MSLTLKLFSLVTRTVAKPVGNYIKQQAREHERFRNLCVSFAQRLHRIDMRMRLGLLQDPAVIERQVKRETAEAVEKLLKAQNRPPSSTPTAKTEAETKADAETLDKQRKQIEEKVKAEEKKKGQRMIRPLSEAKAIETGANFISESFVFAVALSLLLLESWRSKRKESNRREDVKERLDVLEASVEAANNQKALLESQISALRVELGAFKTTPNAPRAPSGPDVADDR